MSEVTATPHLMAAAAGDLASVGSTINAANSAAAAGTAGVEAPGGDGVSAFVSALFSAHSKAYQAAGAQAAYYHDQFVQALRASAGTYASTEAVNASPLQKVQEFVGAASQSPAGHLIGNTAHGAMDAAQHSGTSGPVPGSVGAAPVSANHVGAGAGASTGDAHAAAAGGPPGGNAGGASAVTGDGGGPGGGGGGGGDAPQPAGGAVSVGGGTAAAAVPPTWGAAPAAPAGPLVPGIATPPPAPHVTATAYPAAAVLPGLDGVSGHSAAVTGLGEPVAPAGSVEAVPPPAAPAIPTAPKAQPLHQGGPAHPGDAAQPDHSDRDKAAVPLPIPPLRLRSLRGLRDKLRLRLRDKDEWRDELREAATSKPWGRDELLGALGLRPPAN
ncbi:PE family protein [Mycobacterium sp. UM_CSW]|uniref:PE family protein n=1 Tax=Mycobacterium sp. UM_CSW TaxID=1370119 RepID=UPI0004244BA7|nr:PE family protein [Mycobacterium sp. UM_CSW]